MQSALQQSLWSESSTAVWATRNSAWVLVPTSGHASHVKRVSLQAGLELWTEEAIPTATAFKKKGSFHWGLSKESTPYQHAEQNYNTYAGHLPLVKYLEMNIEVDHVEAHWQQYKAECSAGKMLCKLYLQITKTSCHKLTFLMKLLGYTRDK